MQVTNFQIIQLLVGSGIGIPVIKWLISKLKTQDTKIEAVCFGTQALLRDRLIATYNYYMDKGYAPIYIRENFENMYKQYHALGGNGVMDDLHEDFKKLPTMEVEKK